MKYYYLKLSDAILPQPDFDEDERSIEAFFGDMDLDLYHWMDGPLIGWDDTHLWIEKGPDDDADLMNLFKAYIILEGVTDLHDDDHMELYNQYGKFHDGGDDFDYGGTYLHYLAIIIKENRDKFYIK